MSRTGAELLEVVRGTVGDPLRDVWVFGEDDERAVFVREDVKDALDALDPEPYIDNERYGYITRATYEELTYADYEYTVRGFDSFETFRTFLGDVGVLVSVDAGNDVNYGELYATLAAADLDLSSVLGGGGGGTAVGAGD